MKTMVHVGLAFTVAAGFAFGDSLALVAADSTAAEMAVQSAFQATGKFTAVTIIDTQTSTPALATLKDFTHVLAWASAAPFDRVGLGNVLADFYDLGGKHLTVATYALSTIPSVSPFFLPDPEIQGRAMTGQYAAFTNVHLTGDLSGALVPAVPNDPVWTGIDPTKIFYFENQYMAHPALGQGATLIAADGSGASAIGLMARSQNGVMNVNFYPGGPQGESMGNNNAALFQLLTNTFPASQAVTDTTPPTTSASLAPAPNAKGWNNSNVTVTLTAIDNPSGSGVKQISVTLSGAQSGSSVVTGNTAPIQVMAEGSTTLSYFSTDNAGNAETPKTLTVLLDKTPPSVTATANPLPDAHGNNTTPVTVTFTATDTLSGVNACTPPITLTASGTANGSCTDIAGNTATASKTITIVPDPPPTPTGSGPAIHGVPAAGSCVLHHAHHEFVHVATLSVDPAQAVSFDVTGVSNEPPDKDDNDIVIHGKGLDPRVIKLRAEQLKNGADLVYTLTAKAANKSGQTTTASFTCTVPHHQDTDDDSKPGDPDKH